MGQMKKRAYDQWKMPSIEENVIIEMVSSLPALHKIDYEFHAEASRPDMTSTEFTRHVERSIGGYFHDKLRDQIDWEYVALHWWDEREVMQIPEDDINYNR
jgi:hypothetical protein